MPDSLLRASSGSVLLDVLVVPNASRSEVRGVDPWRHALRVRLAAKPEGGAANDELLRLLSEILGLPVNSLTIVAGAASRRKTVAIAGADRETLAHRLPAEGLR